MQPTGLPTASSILSRAGKPPPMPRPNCDMSAFQYCFGSGSCICQVGRIFLQVLQVLRREMSQIRICQQKMHKPFNQAHVSQYGLGVASPPKASAVTHDKISGFGVVDFQLPVLSVSVSCFNGRKMSNFHGHCSCSMFLTPLQFLFIHYSMATMHTLAGKIKRRLQQSAKSAGWLSLPDPVSFGIRQEKEANRSYLAIRL